MPLVHSDFLADCLPETPVELSAKYPAGLTWSVPISAGFVGTSMQTFSRLMLFRNWI